MSQSLASLTRRLDALQADLTEKQADIQAAVKKVAKAEEALLSVDGDERVVKAVKEQVAARRALERAREKLGDKNLAVEKAKKAVRKGIDLEGKTSAYNAAKQAADNVQRQLEDTTREIRALSRAGAHGISLEDERSRGVRRLGREPASDDEELGLSQAEIYALVYNPRLVRHPHGGGAPQA